MVQGYRVKALVITTVRFKSLVKLLLIFFLLSHDATLSRTGLHVAQHASTDAPLIRCLIFHRAASDDSREHSDGRETDGEVH